MLQQFNIPAVLADDRAQDRGLFLELIDPALRRERFEHGLLIFKITD